MHQDIENIIKKNFPEEKICRYENNDEIIEVYPKEYADGFNQALSQINTSLIADEVLKVVKREIIHIIEKDYQDEYRISGEFGEKRIDTELYHKIINGLTNSSTLDGERSEHLSPNKENKK